MQTNPISLVTVKDSSKRLRQPRSLTMVEFQRFVAELDQPFQTIALVCVCFGLRVSECLALKWSDVDWLHGKLSLERAIVRQRVDAVKTIYSGRTMSIDPEMLTELKTWRQTSQFAGDQTGYLLLQRKSAVNRGLTIRCGELSDRPAKQSELENSELTA